MLIVTGIIRIDPENLAAARAAALVMMAETRREPGCLVYEFSQLVEDESRFRVYEEWQDAAALEAHSKTPHMAVFRKALAAAGVLSREIVAIETGKRTPLG